MTYNERIQKAQLYDKDTKITTKFKLSYIAFERKRDS